ncbi:MAG: EAL domain-containing protein [Steroidobacteraceae bacterium]|jgi:EAL domain-containing protein (putative c-di-GMP-specific phosphodiesterase class I)
MTQSSPAATLLARASGFDQIGSELLNALDACRPQCLSLHDASGDVLWLNAGVIGPDEHGYVLDALDELSLEPERTHMQRRLADNRRALFMGARDPAGNCSALVFVVLDCPGGPEDNQPMPANLAALMRRLSMQVAPTAAKIAATHDPRAAMAAMAAVGGSRPATIEVTELELEPEAAPAKPVARPEPRAAFASTASSRAAEVEVTELELEPNEPPTKQPSKPAIAQPIAQSSGEPAWQPVKEPVTQQIAEPAWQPLQEPIALPISESASQPLQEPIKQSIPKPASKPAAVQKAAAVSEANAVTMIAPVAPMEALAAAGLVTQSTGESLPIRARKFVRLHGRGSNRRYEVAVLPHSEGQDIRILKSVSAWLHHHLDQYTEEHASFAVPISPAAALDGRFVAALGGALSFRSLPEGMLGLLLPSAAWRHPGTGPLLAQCERLQCPVTLDDFSLRHDGFQILRNKAIRMVKLDPQITGPAMNDRFARAALAAITQSARVLGLHCIAKGDISSSRARWLATAGIDYADPTTASAASAQAQKVVARRSLEQA